MVDNLTPLNQVFAIKLSTMTGAFSNLTSPVVAQAMAQYSMYGDLVKQATLWGYIETFRFFAVAAFTIIPLIYLIRKSGIIKKKKDNTNN